jgi:hypothetical protein
MVINFVYWDNRRCPVDPTYVNTPTAFGVFAHETVSEGEPPRSYLERVYNIQRWTVFPRGGHFAPVEAPAVVAGDLTAFFTDLSRGPSDGPISSLRRPTIGSQLS